MIIINESLQTKKIPIDFFINLLESFRNSLPGIITIPLQPVQSSL